MDIYYPLVTNHPGKSTLSYFLLNTLKYTIMRLSLFSDHRLWQETSKPGVTARRQSTLSAWIDCRIESGLLYVQKYNQLLRQTLRICMSAF